MNILLIGTGPMAEEYLNIIEDLGYNYVVVGRSKKSVSNFRVKTGQSAHSGGIEAFLKKNKIEPNTKAILATGPENLIPITKRLIESGIKNILIEKPAALSIEELLENENDLKKHKGIYVAYNRRFYESVIEAEKIIENDGGLSTVKFEFTEWSHKINLIQKAPGVKENWFFANSTHVVDLAFFLAGTPITMSTFSQKGNLEWHEKSIFAGAGETSRGILFSYMANWESAGRWNIELLTCKRRIFLQPLEKLFIQKIGSTKITEHHFSNDLDVKYKPGLFLQTKAFLDQQQNAHRLKNIREHINDSKTHYQKILNSK